MKVKEIKQVNERTLGIRWTDARYDEFDVVDLRAACPCAACVDEITSKRIITRKDIPDTVRPVKIESVGQYALKIFFSDGHSTGIYTFSKLRSLNSP